MKITRFDVRLLSIPYAQPIRWANVVETACEALVLRIETDGECFGLAQKKIQPPWSGSTSRSVAVELKEIYQPMLAGVDPLAFEHVWGLIDEIPLWSSSKTLVDIALHDIAARAAGLPMWKYLGGWTDEVPVSGFIPRGLAEQRIEEMRALIARFGFTVFKVKIGRDPKADCAFLARLREAFGDDVSIRVDANSDYTPSQAIAVSRELAALGITEFEDPCPLEGSYRSHVMQRSAVPVIVDRFAHTFANAAEAVRDGAGGISIKTARLGFRRGRLVHDMCREAGAMVVAGSNSESKLGALIALHFYAALRHFRSAPAEDSFFATLPDDVFEPAVSIVGGKVRLPSTPGLVSVWDEEKFQRLSVSLND